MGKKGQILKHVMFLLFFVAWFAYFYVLWRDMVVFDGADLRVGGINVWGDWAMHFTQGSSFAYRSLFLTQHPLLLGAPYAYPFAVNWISGVLVRMGMEFFSAFVIPSFAYSLFFVVVLTFLFWKIFHSRAVAMLATTIFLLNGGLGWWWYVQDLIASPNWITALRFAKEYTHLTSVGIQWISVITSMIVPQRSFVFGYSYALLILLLVFRHIERARHAWSMKWFIGFGVVCGLMPVIHMHSFIMLAIIFGWWMLWSLARKEDGGRQHALACWIVMGCITLLLASPLFITFFSQTVGKVTRGSFIQWYPGWFVNKNAEHAGMDWSWWWFLNWGITLPVGIVGWSIATRKLQVITLPFFMMFVLLNLFLFQPYVWDNTKVLVWASLGVSSMAAYTVWKLWQKHIVLKICAGLLFLIMILAGTLDAYGALDKRKHNWSMYEAQALIAVDAFRHLSKSDDVILASDSHNNPFINLSGRQVVMGFRGWLWTYGFDYGPIEQDVLTIFCGEMHAQELLKKYNIKYVIFDDKVRNEYKGNEEYFSRRYHNVLESGQYVVYEIK